ncbi:MAG: cation transporter [Bacteroidota bacterium]
MQKTIFDIPQMDCPSEENLIRMKLDGVPGVCNLEFDLAHRSLSVFHEGSSQPIEQSIAELNLGGKKRSTESVSDKQVPDNQQQRRLLWAVLAINFSFFLLESTTGILSKSMGLVADSLDMLADSLVYGISLLAVGGTLARKKRAASLAGYLQIGLAVIGLLEVFRRFFGTEQLPDPSTIMWVSALALLANATCLFLLQKSRNKEEAHIQASMIFTSNDVIINLGVLTAGLLVYVFQSSKPDLLIGIVVFGLVIQGAFRILALGK